MEERPIVEGDPVPERAADDVGVAEDTTASDVETTTTPTGEEAIAIGSHDEQLAVVLDHPSADQVDEERFAELERKRDEEGLTQDEANELGWMIAAKEGKPYSNADARHHPDETPAPESRTTLGTDTGEARQHPREPEGKPLDEEAKDIAR